MGQGEKKISNPQNYQDNLQHENDDYDQQQIGKQHDKRMPHTFVSSADQEQTAQSAERIRHRTARKKAVQELQ
jgi:hypothetical protein